MKGLIRIFVEGKADKKFLEDYLNFLKLEALEIIDVGGYTKLNLQKNKFIENTIDGGKNLVVFDANRDTEKRRQKLSKNKSKYEIEFELFLLPNNQASGAFEDLLLNITLQEHQQILACFDLYQECIKENEDYHLPAKKAKIFAYLEALLGKKITRDEKRDYLNNLHWNLGHSYLQPLKEFLEKNFTE